MSELDWVIEFSKMIEDVRYVKKELRIPIYRYKVLVVVTEDVKEYSNRHDGTDYVDCPVACVNDLFGQDKEQDFVLIMSLREGGEDTITHETFHIATRIMRYIGCPLVEATEEPYAYLQDWLVKNVRNYYRELKSKLMDIIREEENHVTNSRKEVPETVVGDRSVVESETTGIGPH